LEFNTNDATLYQVDEMKGKTYTLVKWKGYPDQFNSFEPLEDMQDIPSR